MRLLQIICYRVGLKEVCDNSRDMTMQTVSLGTILFKHLEDTRFPFIACKNCVLFAFNSGNHRMLASSIPG